jgi:hypothetical protein
MGLDTYFVRTSKNALKVHELFPNDKYIEVKYVEVAYFRKFWSLLHRFDYTDQNYGDYIEVPKEKIESLRDEAKKTILMVEKHLTDDGWEIETSALDISHYTDVRSNDYASYLIVLKNGIFTDELEEQADSICNSVYQESDSFLFSKVVYLYHKFTEVLESTDWDKEIIMMESDW